MNNVLHYKAIYTPIMKNALQYLAINTPINAIHEQLTKGGDRNDDAEIFLSRLDAMKCTQKI